MFVKPFLPVHVGPVSKILYQTKKNNGLKSRDTVPLTEIFTAWVF